MKVQSDPYLQKLIQELQKLEVSQIYHLESQITSMIRSEKTLFICGNGGSAATSSHMACDLGKTILGKNPRTKTPRLRVVSLNDCIPLMTAWANDEGYQYIFAEQLKNLGKKGDVLIVITGSGNSANIIEAVKEARRMKIKTFGLLGFDGGKVKEILDEYVLIRSTDYGIIEDVHAIINHLLTDSLKKSSK